MKSQRFPSDIPVILTYHVRDYYHNLSADITDHSQCRLLFGDQNRHLVQAQIQRSRYDVRIVLSTDRRRISTVHLIRFALLMKFAMQNGDRQAQSLRV